ncbi:hypothetical protein GCM10022255_099030 [Dactylosporangium darangshiense]|uniref:Uncharacterized protein n=1 Tax=Dactylosporangium darangshiense TaxID=579108 RepID=A0ABP8DRB7_9ACTN
MAAELSITELPIIALHAGQPTGRGQAIYHSLPGRTAGRGGAARQARPVRRGPSGAARQARPVRRGPSGAGRQARPGGLVGHGKAAYWAQASSRLVHASLKGLGNGELPA